MKTLTKVNIVSTVIFIASLGGWVFLATDYVRIRSEHPVVKGARTAQKIDDDSVLNIVQAGSNSAEERNNSILDEAVIIDDVLPEVEEEKVEPVKKKDVGKTYVRAKAAVAMDVNSEKILHNQNARDHLPIASLTKLMTALVVIDHISDLDREIVTIDEETCQMPTTVVGCPSSSYCFSDTLKLGEQVRARDLLEAMLVNSANDAAVALGNHVAGSQEAFANLMNKKAREIGLENSHFCNASGLDDDEHPERKCYSSAEDVAKIVVYALKNDKYNLLWPIFKIKERWFTSVDGRLRHKYATTNILLETMSNCQGAKTGFTYDAGKTLMMIANHPKDKDIKVVSVILNDPYRFDDMRQLFDWIFANYEWKRL